METGAPRHRQQGAVPGRHPGLGFLFRSKARTDNKDELLIFVTPKILREGADIF